MFGASFRQWVWIAAANAIPRFGKFDHLRWRFLRLAGVRISRCHVRGPVNLTQFGHLDLITIGEGTFINTGLRIGVAPPATVTIGRNCTIAPGVSFETMGHELKWTPERGWGGEAKPISVGDRCWIGARAVVIGGVSIGEGAVVAAGAVVVRSVDPYTLVGGVPAKVLRQIT